MAKKPLLPPRPAPVSRIRVLPKDDSVRRLIKHPRGGAFRGEGSVEWPLDGFTKRRLADGTITREEKETALSKASTAKEKESEVFAPRASAAEPEASAPKSEATAEGQPRRRPEPPSTPAPNESNPDQKSE